MVRKRKDTPQSATLHDYFSKPGEPSSANKKLKPNHHERKPKAKREPFVPDEIIIIDSDEELPKLRPGRAVLVDSDSDVVIVESPPPRPVRNSAAKGPLKSTSFSKKPARTGNLVSASPVDGQSLFGEPSMLLRPCTLGKAEAVDNLSFGVPTSLLCSAVDTASFNNLLSETGQSNGSGLGGEGSSKHSSSHAPSLLQDTPSSTAQKEEAAEVEQALLAIDNDWGTGDDEVEVAFDGDTLGDAIQPSADVDTDMPLDYEPTDMEETCPVCGSLLRSMCLMEIQQHVNQCIDASSDTAPAKSSTHAHTTTIPSAVTPPVSKPAKPLPLIVQPSDLVATIVSRSNTATIPSADKSSDAFSVLMTSHKEKEAWKEATAVEDPNFRPTKGNGGRRKAPFYKVLQGMPIAVDAFRYGTIPGVTAYFLTHAHSDHYTNLSSNWKSGPIYCSHDTANLIIHMLAVDPKWVHPLPMDVATIIPESGGVSVTLIEANHCPGSCLFLFEGPQTVDAGDSVYKSPFVGSPRTFRYLHCGDFRASPQHVMHPAVRGKRIDHVYLDTTYLDPKYCFPPQPQVITACAELAKRIVTGRSTHGDQVGADGKKARTMDRFFSVRGKGKDKESANAKTGKTLVVVGTYSIGKERIVKAIAHALNSKIYCDARKAAILRCQSDPELHALLTSDPLEAGIHLLPLGVIASDKLKIYLDRWKGHFAKAVGFRPTGWTFSQPSGSETTPSIPSIISRSQQRTFSYANLQPMKNSTATLQLYGVPYSEHSSFFELTCFALSLDWGRMIATVNVGSENSRGKMAKWVERWEAERKKRDNVEIVEHRAPDYW